MSSSGLVSPFASSLLAGQETSNVPIFDEFKVTLPLPCAKFPSQIAEELRVVVISYSPC